MESLAAGAKRKCYRNQKQEREWKLLRALPRTDSLSFLPYSLVKAVAGPRRLKGVEQ